MERLQHLEDEISAHFRSIEYQDSAPENEKVVKKRALTLQHSSTAVHSTVGQ